MLCKTWYKAGKRQDFLHAERSEASHIPFPFQYNKPYITNYTSYFTV